MELAAEIIAAHVHRPDTISRLSECRDLIPPTIPLQKKHYNYEYKHETENEGHVAVFFHYSNRVPGVRKSMNKQYDFTLYNKFRLNLE